MKKLAYVLAAAGILAFASCVRTVDCECVDEDGIKTESTVNKSLGCESLEWGDLECKEI